MAEEKKPTLGRPPSWVWWLPAVLIILSLFAFCRGGDKTTKQSSAAATSQPAPTKPERTIEVIAPVGRLSENVSIPLLHWFRIAPEGKIRIRLWNGQEMDSEPGNDTWYGDDILDANFRFMSRETGDVKVKVVMRPK